MCIYYIYSFSSKNRISQHLEAQDVWWQARGKLRPRLSWQIDTASGLAGSIAILGDLPFEQDNETWLFQKSKLSKIRVLFCWPIIFFLQGGAPRLWISYKPMKTIDISPRNLIVKLDLLAPT